MNDIRSAVAEVTYFLPHQKLRDTVSPPFRWNADSAVYSPIRELVTPMGLVLDVFAERL